MSILKRLSASIKARFKPHADGERFLRTRFGTTFFRTFQVYHVDRRSWMTHAAVALHRSQEDLLMEFAEANGAPFIGTIPEIVFGDPVEEELFMRVGSIPIVDKAGAVLGIASVDPLWAQKQLQAYSAYDWYTASWEQIAARFRAPLAEAPSAASRAVQPEEILEKICGAISTIEYRALAISLTDRRYTVTRLDGATMLGDLHPRLIQPLSAYLQGRAQLHPTTPLLVGTMQFYLTVDTTGSYVLEKRVAPHTATLHQFPQRQQQRSNTVLLVDDNKSFLSIVSQYLTKQGMSVMTVHDGEQAQQFLETQDMLPAVIVCDLHMPKKNGFEFVQAMKQDERFRDIPVISLTSDKDVEAEISLLKLGVAAFISKSEDPRILALHVMRHVVIDDSKKAA